MSVNKFRPHILVLPEDGANREVANGFHLRVDLTRQRRMQVLPVAGGWSEALKRFELDHVNEMDRNPNRFMVLLIDFDGRLSRLATARNAIPGHLADRVFVIGKLTKPEDLKDDLGGYESVGQAIADDCLNSTNVTWGHKLLEHNADELERLRELVCSILFQRAELKKRPISFNRILRSQPHRL